MGEGQNVNQMKMNDILEQLPDGMFTLDTNLIIQYANPAFCRLLGFAKEEIVGSSITDHLGDLDILQSCMSSVAANGYCNDQETVFKRKDGRLVHISKNVQAIYDAQGNIQNILVSIRDLTSLHELNKQLLHSKSELERYTDNLETIIAERTNELTHRLLYDRLTGLPNRLKMINDIDEIKMPHLLILLNIDSFNEINTFYGHTIGDSLLSAMADFLSSISPKLGDAQVYKLPVDEYAIIIKNPPHVGKIEEMAKSLSQWITDHVFLIEGQEINLNATMGIAFSEDVGDESILLRSDMGLKLAKKTRQDFTIYNQQFHIKENYQNNLVWIKRLRSAIENNRVVPYYQPIVDAQTGKTEKYEALVRIIEEDGTVITPFHFLDISKKVKLYPKITKIMIEKVFETLRYAPFKCSINLSIEDINDPEIHTFIIEKVQNYPQSAQIIFEILESEGIENYDVVNSFIAEVKKYGVQIALDDFGAGYSNFAYITKLNIDYIKIDGSIIRDIDVNPVSQIITQTIIDFSQKLGIQTVAEFVSSESIRDYLKTLPIDAMQGYLFGQPAPLMES